VLYYVRAQEHKGQVNDICYSFQEAALDAIMENVIRAAEVTKQRGGDRRRGGGELSA